MEDIQELLKKAGLVKVEKEPLAVDSKLSSPSDMRPKAPRYPAVSPPRKEVPGPVREDAAVEEPPDK